MIRVSLAEEPPEFDSNVRQPGLDAIRELVGQKPNARRTGPKRKKVARRPQDIPARLLPPFWRNALPWMCESYQRICAYLALYIEPVTGSATIDHFVPISQDRELTYEWSNYRLACSLINARKGTARVLDPFDIQDDWFALELVTYQVVPGPGAPGASVMQVEETIEILRLNDIECCTAREEYVEAYFDEHAGIPLSYLERRAPFVARELRRQRRLRDGDN